jgi:hypothetical protein
MVPVLPRPGIAAGFAQASTVTPLETFIEAELGTSTYWLEPLRDAAVLEFEASAPETPSVGAA